MSYGKAESSDGWNKCVHEFLISVGRILMLSASTRSRAAGKCRFGSLKDVFGTRAT